MPTLLRWLASRTDSERATLARLWSIPEKASRSSVELAEVMLRAETVERILAALGPRERAALTRVQEYGGSIPGAVLEREFGGVRNHADYPNPRAYLLALEQPATPTERLYTLALLHLAQEGMRRTYAILPDLLALLAPVPERDHTLELPPAGEPERVVEGDLRFLERNLLMLLALGQDGLLEVIPAGGLNKASLVRIARLWDPKDNFKGAWREEHWPYIRFVRRIGEGARLLRAGADARLRPTRDALEWLRLPLVERARRLLEGWVESDWDELVSFGGMKIQRSYFRDLPAAKRAILQLIGQVRPGQWVSFDDFVAAVKRVEPDFARPDGRYDTWGLLSYTRQPLNGFEHWDEVEGQQLRVIASGTLRWLGLTDLGAQGEEAVSFRVSQLGAVLLGSGSAPTEPP
jgi:hypothetical protein